MNEPRVYKHSPWSFLAIAFLVIFFGISLFGMDISSSLLFGAFFLLIILISVFSLTAKTMISEDEISTFNLFGTKTLRWSEISRVSGKGFGIKLHNFDGDVTVAPSPQVPNYEEVVERIGQKRPDLFNPLDYGEMSRGLLGSFAQIFLGLAVIGFGIFIYLSSDGVIFPLIFLLGMGVFIIGMTIFAPQSISIQGNSIVVEYFFNQKTLTAGEIGAVKLGFTKTRNGKNYFVSIQLLNGQNIRVSGLQPNLPVVYHVLKNWYRKNVSQTL